jgi:hypothetical protein
MQNPTFPSEEIQGMVHSHMAFLSVGMSNQRIDGRMRRWEDDLVLFFKVVV